MKTGVMNDGTIVAREVETWWNGGAFADIGPRVTQKSGFTAAGPYDIEHVELDSVAVYTNLPPAGAFRGFGIPQLVWAYESQADIIARELGIDPVAFRLKNVLRDGDEHATGTVMQQRQGRRMRRERGASDRLGPAVRSRQRPDSPRARHRGRHQGLDLADDVGRARDGGRRRQLHAGDLDRRHGPGLRYRDGAGGGRNARHSHRVDRGRALRHRHDALRHGDARFALDLSHGPRRAAGGRRCAQSAARARRDLSRRAGRDVRVRGRRHLDERGQVDDVQRALRRALRYAGRQRRRHRFVRAALRQARHDDRAIEKRHAVLDDRRDRGRDHGRYGNRPHQRSTSASPPATSAARSIPRSSSASSTARRSWRSARRSPR